MIFALADDFREAMAAMPRTHPAFPKVAILNDALLGSVAGLAEQPRYLTQTLTNRLRRRPLSVEARELIDRGEVLLADFEWWLCADDGVVETHQWQGIVAVSPHRGLTHCLRDGGAILDCRMDTQEVVGTHRAPPKTAVAVAVCPGDGRVAVVAADGGVWTDDGVEPVALRPRANCFAGLSNGFIGIDAQANLIYWDRSTAKPVRLASEMPPVGCTVSTGPSGETAVIVAGDRPRTQRLFVIDGRKDSAPVCRTWSGDGRLVTAACLDDQASRLVLATVDRQLSLVDLDSGLVLHRIALAQSPGRPLGEVTHCAYAASAGDERVLFAVVDGIVALWDTPTGRIRRMGQFRAIDSPSPLVCLEWLADGEHFLIATHDSLQVLGIAESTDTDTDTDISPTAIAATNCAMGADGWLVLVQEKAQRVTWIRDGTVRKTFCHPALRPRSVASIGPDGEILVGGLGTLARLHPGREPSPDDALDIFDRPLVAVLPQDPRTAAAVCETGEVKLVRLSEEWVQPMQPPVQHWEQGGACRLGEGRDIVCWGRLIAGACASRVYVIYADGRIEEVFTGRDLVVDVVSTVKGPLICVAVHDEVIAYAREGGVWQPVMRRAERVNAMAVIGPDLLAVLPTAGHWLELWSTSASLKTLAMGYIPVSATCISTAGHAILLGTQDGRHVLMTAHHHNGASK